MQHIIKKQIIQIELEGNQDSFRIQQLVSEYYWKEIIPILQKVFDAISKQGEVVSIEHLEIDLGVISIKDIEQGKWVDKIEAALKEELTKNLRDINSDKGQRRETNSQSACSQWMYYMENGYLPWNVLKVDQSWYDQTLQTLASDFNSISELRQRFLSNTVFTRRVISQHPESFLINLVETLTAEKQAYLPVAITELYEIQLFINKNIRTQKNHLPDDIADKTDFIRNIWSHILKMASKNEKNTNTEIFVENILIPYISEPASVNKINKALSGKLRVTLPVLEKLYLKLRAIKKEQQIKENQTRLNKNDIYKQSENVKNPSADQSKQEKEKIKNKKDKSNLQDNIPSQSNSSPQNDSDKTSGADANELKISDKQNQVTKDDGRDEMPEIVFKPDNEKLAVRLNQEKPIFSNSIDEEEIFIQHAGIVLLHPFLTSFFKRLHLITEEGFTDSSAQQTAIQLLHFLGTGNYHPNEYELVMAKLLCAYPLRKPVETGFVISELEINEANDLFAAAIAQWEVLKNSSADALREGFLQRNGKIFSKKGRLNLIVEKSAIDILLDRLPWNLSMIKLPWMDDILWVEWR